MTTINLTINGQSVVAKPGQTVLEAARDAGIHIPTLCYHPALPPVGYCRICLVEDKARGVQETSCTLQVHEGMVIETESPTVLEKRRLALELILSEHPLDCMTCEQAGNCELQDLAYEFGIKESSLPHKLHNYPVTDPNPFIERDYNKCIMCERCVSACRELNGVEAIYVFNRGFDAKIGTVFDGNLEDSPCEFCGQCVAVCPTGALTERQAKGRGRTWEMTKVTTTCGYCGVGCQFDLNIKDGQVVKVTSNWDAPANGGMLCVKGRFGFEYINHPDRLTKPLVRKELAEELNLPQAENGTSA
ncbi:MAG TPA: 4Fe-4S dicluster domain-containing protein, partial [Anaerolineae bacterium]|nr:4Fe-4S dicluster domain-containing protein [Anaerolineae bacterium]